MFWGWRIQSSTRPDMFNARVVRLLLLWWQSGEWMERGKRLRGAAAVCAEYITRILPYLFEASALDRPALDHPSPWS